MSIRVLDPTVETAPGQLGRPRASDVTRQAGRLGCWTMASSTSTLLDHMEKILRSQYGVTDVVRLQQTRCQPSGTGRRSCRMQSCDAVISAVGD